LTSSDAFQDYVDKGKVVPEEEKEEEPEEQKEPPTARDIQKLLIVRIEI
jgi:hypothetical protein